MSYPCQALRVAVVLLCGAFMMSMGVVIYSIELADATGVHARVQSSAEATRQRRTSLALKAATHTDDPLSTQDASIDLDSAAGDDDNSETADLDAEGLAGDANENSGLLREKPLPSQISIQGDIMMTPISAAPVDMSVVPEPVPRVDAMEPPSLPVYGGTSVLRVVGQHFGTSGELDQTISIGGQACKSTRWVSSVALDCIGPPAHSVHTRASVQVIIAGSRSDPDRDGSFLKYEPPIVQRLVPAVGPTHGNTQLRVLGRNFGDFNVAGASSPTVTIGDLPCTSPRLINSTEIQCRTVARTEGSGPMLVHVEVDGFRSNDTVPSESATPEEAIKAGSQNVFTYELPTVHLLEPDSGPTFGGVRITIFGTGFGSRDEVLVRRKVLIGGKPCEGIKVTSEREMSCKLPSIETGSAGASGISVDVVVTIGTYKAVAATMLETSKPKELQLRYLDMSISSVLPADPYVMQPVELIIIGTELAPWDIRPHACPHKSDLQQCRPDTVNAVGHSKGGSIVSGSSIAGVKSEDCKLVEETHSGPCTREDPLCNGGGRFTCSCAHPTYPNDEKSRLLSRPLCKVDSKKVPTILFRSDEDNEDENGDGEGDKQPTYACPRVSVDHPTQLRCHLPKDSGLGGPTNVTVVRHGGNGGEATTVFTLLDRPVITEIIMPRRLDGRLTLRGQNFGSAQNAMTVQLGSKKCVSIRRIFSSEEHGLDTLTCQVEAGEFAPGADDGLDVRIFAKDTPPADLRRGVRAEIRADLSLPHPVIESVVPPIIATFGLTNITVTGENIANVLFPSHVFLNGRACENVRKISSKKLICSAPSLATSSNGTSPSLPLKVSVEVKIRHVNGSLPNGITYGQARITSVSPRRIASVGGDTVRIRGYLLGNEEFPWAPLVKLGEVPCASAHRSEQNPNNEFVCTSSRAQPGNNLQVSVEVAPGIVVSAPIATVIPPQLTAISPNEGPSYGEDIMTITGSGFGTNKNIVVARVDGVACVKTTLVSDSEVKCETPKQTSGAENEVKNARVLVSVEVAGVESQAVNTAGVVLTTYIYKPVSPARIDPGFGPSYGGEAFTIFGRYLGRPQTALSDKKHLVPEVFVGTVPCAESVLQEDEETLTCVPAPGSGSQPVTVVVNGMRSPDNPVLSYEYRPPRVQTISPRTGPTYGGGVVDVRGSNLGTSEDMPVLTFGKDAVCKNVEVVVPHRHGQTGPGSPLFSYPPPLVKQNKPQGGNGTGGNIVYIYGSNFGDEKYLGNDTNAYIGKRRCISTHIITDSLIECLAPPGVGESLDVTVVAGGQSSVNPWSKCIAAQNSSNQTVTPLQNMSNSSYLQSMSSQCRPSPSPVGYSYPSPLISQIMPDSVSSKGGDLIEIFGKNFGVSGEDVEVTLAGKLCTNLTVVSSSVIKCRAPSGKGDMIPVRIITGGQPSNIFDNFEYDGPRVYASVPKMARNKTDESTNITIYGINLGLEKMEGVFKLTVGGYPCTTSVYHSSTSWSCQIEEKGRMGREAPVQILIPGRHHPSPPNGSFAGFTFKASPELSKVSPPFGPSQGEGVLLTLHGKFGPSKPKYFSVKIGESECLNNGGKWISPSLASCILPPGTGHKEVTVLVNGATAHSPPDFPVDHRVTFDYDPPILRSIYPKTGPGKGGNIIHLFGKFEVTANGLHSLQVTVDGTECAMISTNGKQKNIANTTHLACVAPQGAGAKRDVRVLSKSGAQSQPLHYSYERPRITAVLPLPGEIREDVAIPNTVDGRRITIEAENLGLAGKHGATPRAIKVVLASMPGSEKRGGEECKDVRWEGLRSVSCLPSPGYGSRALVIVVAGQYSPVAHMTYIAPQVIGIEPLTADPGDSISVKIFGRNFGPKKTNMSLSQLDVSIGKQTCTNVRLTHAETTGENDIITCNITVRPGGNKRVKVVVSGQESPEKGPRFSSTLPIVDSVTPNTCRLTGGCHLAITGKHFFPGVQTQVLIGRRECTEVKVMNTRLIYCIAPKGKSGPQRLLVNVKGAKSVERTGTPLFKYPVATVTSVRPTHGSRSGGTVVTISGAGFGETIPQKGSLTALIGGVPCTETVWESDTKVKCTVPPEGVVKPGEDSSCMSVRVRVGPGKDQISKRNAKWRYEHQISKESQHSIQITPANVEQVITGDRPVMIKLCSPNCKQCQKLKHPWNEVARLLKCKQVIVASVRGDLYPTLLDRFGVEDYPRIIWVPEGLTTPSKEYTGVFSAERIIGWVARQFGQVNTFWSPLENGDAGEDWGQKISNGTDVSPLLVGSGPLPPSQERCRAVKGKVVPSQAEQDKPGDIPLNDLHIPEPKIDQAEDVQSTKLFYFF